MKKIMIFAAFAAALSLASCQKEGLNEVVKNDPSAVSESPIFTGTINAGTKTTVDASSGKVSWETTDEITVTDKDQKTSVYSIESIDGTTGRATFVYKSGDTLGEGPYTATYGTEPATDQTYSATPGKIYMTAPETSTNSFNFTVQCALMEINLTKSGESVSSVAVTGTPTDGTKTTYILTCIEAQSIESTKSFYITVPAGVYNKIVITDSDDKVCTLIAASGITVANNHIKPLTFVGSKLDFIPAGALPGVFSVSDTKKVHFSQGNLWADGDKALHFEANQYSSASSWDASHVSHFTWSSTVEYAVDAADDSYSGDNLFCDESHKVSVDGGEAIYYALSKEEWQYLFNNNIKKWVTVNSVNGYVIAPDGFEGELANSYANDAELVTAGNLVFLPAAGDRWGSGVSDVGDCGFYWSSTFNASTEDCAYQVYLDSNGVNPGYEWGYLGCGFSVRLITELN